MPALDRRPEKIMDISGFAEEKVDGDPPELPLNRIFHDLLEIFFISCFTRIILVAPCGGFGRILLVRTSMRRVMPRSALLLR
jgi:hypothetical protein